MLPDGRKNQNKQQQHSALCEVLESRGRASLFSPECMLLEVVRRPKKLLRESQAALVRAVFAAKAWLPALEQARRLIYCPTRKLIYLNF